MLSFKKITFTSLLLLSTLGIAAVSYAAGHGTMGGGSDSSHNWDMDNNGEADALTDGLLMLRYNFGLRGDSLTNGAIALNSTLSPAEVESEISASLSISDVDGDGQVDALTDGLLLLRYLFGLSETSLISGAVSLGATRTTVLDISQYLSSYMPGADVVDTDNDGVSDSNDAFPNDASETLDSDNDGVGNNSDAFPNDASETLDSDNDGVGNNSDAFPNDASETLDSDNDGVGNNADAFPNDPAETVDANGNGIGDNADANASNNSGPQSNYCATPVYHLNLQAEASSIINLTIENIGNNQLRVAIASGNSDAVDFLSVEFPGATISDDTSASSGELAKILSWSGSPPSNVSLTILWSKVSSGGNWIVRDISSPADGVCANSTYGGGNSNNGNTGDSGSGSNPDPDATYQNINLSDGEIKVLASSYSSVEGEVQLETTSDTGGGQNVGYIDSNDALIYNLNISTSGQYTIFYRVASQNGSSPGFEFYLNDVLQDTINVNATNGWQNWVTLEGSAINLTQGNNVVRLKAPVGSLNINWFSFRNDDYVASNPNNPGVGQSYKPSFIALDEVSVSYVVSTNGDDQPKLVGGSSSSKPGYALYTFDSDTVNGSTSSCNGGCAVAWPPLLVSDDTPSGILGLDTITRDDGTEQVTYQGKPLYFYISDSSAGVFSGDNAPGWHSVVYQEIGDVQMLYDANTTLEPVTSFETDDGAIITRLADRGRDRHAKDSGVQDHYDHYLAHYWQYRTMRMQLEDYVPTGQSLIKVTWITEAALGAKEFRVWYSGTTTTGQFWFNPQPVGQQANPNEPGVHYHGSGTWNDDFEKISETGGQHKYTLDIINRWQLGGQIQEQLQLGMNMEFEASMFLLNPPAGSRLNYYGTSFVYVIGEEGVHPFEWSPGQQDGTPIPQKGQSGGGTTLGYNYTNEPAGRFMQMATNMAPGNAESFVLGRRVHHTSFVNGVHGERHDNPVWSEQVGKSGTHYINESCAGCHVRNGRALVADVGGSLDKWVFNVGDENGNPLSSIGSVLQPTKIGGGNSEGSVTLGAWSIMDENDFDGDFVGLRKPNYQFTNVSPPQFSARIAPSLVGIGLLEAIDESLIMSWADENDDDNDNISGRVSMVEDPETGTTRLGRFGYKAGTFSVKHQVASAFNTDMGVMTSMIPNPDCGSQQTNCGNPDSEISDEHVDNLVKYVSLLGVGARRDYNDQTGESLFEEIGCAGCHRPSVVTSNNHPLAELRGQTIYPYTDLLLHDMGPGLADSLGEGSASGSEWRTAPLWGLGLTKNVMLGDAKGNDLVSMARDYPADLNRIGYLHDGRARTIDEAIRWHGGEAETSRRLYSGEQVGNKNGLTDSQRNAVLEFLESL